jgi:hypothetical protein
VPFSHVSRNFQPEQLDSLTAAFDLAWEQLLSANGFSVEFDALSLRSKLAQHILASASTGEFDPEELKDRALRALMRRQAHQRFFTSS